MASPIAAANAYAAHARLLSGLEQVPAAGTANGAGPDFAALVRGALGSVAESGRSADQQTQTFAAGQGNIVDVVTAVSETEVAIQTLVSVRDRVIKSYEEIMRMPI